jgi:hypothetical protein
VLVSRVPSAHIPLMASAGFDTLEVAKRLKGAGFDEAQAEAITGVLRESREADLSRLATKDDIGLVKGDIGLVKDDLGRVKDDLTRVKDELMREIAHLGTTLRAEMEVLRRDLTIRLGGMIVAATGVLLAAKFFG